MLPEGSCIVATGTDERHEILHKVKMLWNVSLHQNGNDRGQLFSPRAKGRPIFGSTNSFIY